jgi:chemotaxis-related protein WspD
LLNRPLSPEYRAERTRQFAAEKKDAEANTVSALIFRVRDEWLGLPATVLQEVVERKPIHSLPHRRHGFILGLANIRGELLICVSLAHLLVAETACSLDFIRRTYSRILVVQWDGVRSAFPVDEVHGPHRLHPASLRPLPPFPMGAQPGCVRQIVLWNDRAVALLDPETLFPRINQPFV